MLIIDNYITWTIGGNFKKLVLIVEVLGVYVAVISRVRWRHNLIFTSA